MKFDTELFLHKFQGKSQSLAAFTYILGKFIFLFLKCFPFQGLLSILLLTISLNRNLGQTSVISLMLI